ncbi:MAG: CHAD domain-containing protein, partial [Alphaproteobacteria bacterium]|nr:CHAD domain-containing protein [Alphaproteobacteria bacterium]
MPNEIELKLDVPANIAPKILRQPWLRAMTSGPIERERLVSVYFDTKKSLLRKHGIVLRVRHRGEKRLQTIKIANGAGGPLARSECESEIDSDTPDLARAKGTALEQLGRKKLGRKLQAIFETSVERVAVPLRSHDSDIELAIDAGEIRATEGSEPVSEIEIELKDGDPAAIASIAERLAKTLPVSFGLRAKGERGYALHAGELGAVVRADTVVLERGATSEAAFRIIASSCLRHFAGNQQAVRDGDPEGVHQMRVGLRRLRAAMSVFKELLEGPQTEAVKAELKWLTEQLGPARDTDVLIEESVAPLRKAEEGKREIGVLETDLRKRRESGFEKARAAIESDRYRKLVLRTGLWLLAGEWSRTEDPLSEARRKRPARAFAAEALTQRHKKIVKKVRKLEGLDGRQLHKLRIAVKKLRYATGFFATLFGAQRDKRQRRFQTTLKALQSSLGKL